MYFDPWSPEPFLQALLEALPDGWSGMCTKPYPEGGEYEDLRLREMTRDALVWAEFLSPDEATSPGERILIGLEAGDMSTRYGLTIGLLKGPGAASALFLSSPGNPVDNQQEFYRLPANTTPAEVAHVLCQLSRAADRRVVDDILHEAAADTRYPAGWFPGERIIVLDPETTGLNEHQDRIVEAAWLLADRRALAWDSVLINPGVPVKDSYRIHAIDDVTALHHGRNPREAIDEVTGAVAKHIVDGVALVVFNRTFDLPFLAAECRHHGLPTLEDRVGRPLKVVDPMRIHQSVQRRGGSSKLADLALLYSPGNTASHSALGDCLATWDVLAALCRNESRAIARRAFNRSARDAQELTLRHLLALS
ncbi:exonuclease domain-containing protein [Streptomyces albogriseolus]|uniref:3'-5' exonuclease n=1 Tax=Streptomyces albogriseolus TaxID=1887 RepID=UPI0036A8B853